MILTLLRKRRKKRELQQALRELEMAFHALMAMERNMTILGYHRQVRREAWRKIAKSQSAREQLFKDFYDHNRRRILGAESNAKR